MTVAIVIPARYDSSRFPGKPLAPLLGPDGEARTLIEWTWRAARAAAGAPSIVIATDDGRIADQAAALGAEVVLTPQSCANGSERCAAALALLPATIDIIVNLQGDAPLTPPHFLDAIVAALQQDRELQVATPVIRATPEVHRRLLDDQAQGRVGGTCCVQDIHQRALYFSKSVIPHVAAGFLGDPETPIFLHIGAYAYRRGALQAYAAMAPTPLELLEGLEQLRFLESGVTVRAVEVDADGADIWELNNPADVPLVEAGLAKRWPAQ